MENRSEPPAVAIGGLCVRRGKRTIIPHLSCRIDAGRITGLLGPSGSGKTTLMRSIVGVQKIRSGAVTVLGEPAGSASLRRRVAYMTQATSVYPDLSVIDNIRFFATLAGAGHGRAEKVADEVGLADRHQQLAGRLSGGQLSRVSLACALVGDPDMLVLDEPTVGQDPLLREELWANLHARAGAGTTILVSSHVMDEAARCDDLLLLRGGELVCQDSPDALLRRTGKANFDQAFLALINSAETASAETAPTHVRERV